MLDYISGKRVSVITNNGNAITSSHDPLVSIILTGGELHGTKCSLVGILHCHHTEDPGEQCFIGVSGITAEGEISTAVLPGNHGKHSDDRAGKGYGRHTGGS